MKTIQADTFGLQDELTPPLLPLPPLTPQAAADYFGVRVGIISSFEENYLIEVEPRERKSSRGEQAAMGDVAALGSMGS